MIEIPGHPITLTPENPEGCPLCERARSHGGRQCPLCSHWADPFTFRQISKYLPNACRTCADALELLSSPHGVD